MKKPDKWTVAGYTALGAMCVAWVAYGWYIVLEGSFDSRPRGSKVSTHVDGLGATFMAFVLLSLAAICTAIILKRFGAPRIAGAVMTAAILGLPVIFLAGRYL